MPDMYAPTARPDEPITAGAAVGPGRGPLHLPTGGEKHLPVAALLAMAIENGWPWADDLRELLEQGGG